MVWDKRLTRDDFGAELGRKALDASLAKHRAGQQPLLRWLLLLLCAPCGGRGERVLLLAAGEAREEDIGCLPHHVVAARELLSPYHHAVRTPQQQAN